MAEQVHIELNVIIPSVNDEKREIAIALLSAAGFESFIDTPSGINGYILSRDFSENEVTGTGLTLIPALEGTSFTYRVVEKVNWNREWESNFHSIIIADRCSVRASFHPKPADAEFDIIINPKMSFGTGHHHTTALMAGMLLDLPVKGKKVLDMGCGTGILAILAAKMEASGVDAVDNDQWAWQNTVENCNVNGVKVRTRLGDITMVKNEKYDIVMANITRNILLENMPLLCSVLNNNGVLLMSGFLNHDLNDLSAAAAREGLSQNKVVERDNWCAAAFGKH